MTHGSCLFLRDYYTERGTHAIGATSSGRMFFGGGALVNRQLFVIWKRRKRAAALRLSDAARALRVVSYPLSVIGEAGGDAAEERRHAKTVLYCSLGTPRAASQSHTAVYSGGGVAPRSVNSWRCFDNSFISVVRSSATYLKSALRFNSSSAST